MRFQSATVAFGMAGTLALWTSANGFQDRPNGPATAPLTEAVWRSDQARLAQLLASGEDAGKPDDQGYAPWMWAMLARNRQALSLLLGRITVIPAPAHKMLPIAAGQNDPAAVRLLLGRGVPVDAGADGDSRYTALLIAASSGYVDTMKELLTAGANPNARDQHHDTPLMAAVRIGSLDAVRLLLNRGADPNQADEGGRSALAWALRSGRKDITDALRSKGARGDLTVARAAPLSARAAVAKSLPLLEHSAATWLDKQTCFSCHHPPMALRVAAVARQRGFAFDAANVRAQFLKTRGAPGAPGARRSLASPEATLRGTLGNFASSSFGNSTALSALADFGAKRTDPDLQEVSISTQALFIARMQLDDGSWRYGGPRIPIESNDFTTTANAARSLDVYGAPEDAAEMRERIARARGWLTRNAAVTTDEMVFRLFGLKWTHADAGLAKQQADALERTQNADGGWAQLRGMNSDAYATGLTLVALYETGSLSVTDQRYQRGVGYLLSTQEPDGTWLVTKRAVPGVPWFDVGFPHGKFQTISYVGTGWASMALMYSSAVQ